MRSLNAELYFFLAHVTKSVGVYTAVIGIFLYHVVFDKDLEWTCVVKTRLCTSYMVLPVCIIFTMLVWMDGSIQGSRKYICCKCVFRAFFISLLWPISVMIDGDWYAYCSHEKILECRELTYEYQMRIKELKNESRMIGFGVLLGIIIVAACLWPTPWKEDCIRCESNKSKYLRKDVFFKKTVLDGGEKFVTKKLIEAVEGEANERIKKYVATGEWWKCYDVVQEIIDEPPSHGLLSESSSNEAKTSV